jgi:hypothetical protein
MNFALVDVDRSGTKEFGEGDVALRVVDAQTGKGLLVHFILFLLRKCRAFDCKPFLPHHHHCL